MRQRYLPRMLTDPVRAVRIEAARALAGPAGSGHRAADRPAFDQALDGIHRRADVQRGSARGADEPRQPLRDRAAIRRRDRRIPEGARDRPDVRRRRTSISPTSTGARRRRRSRGRRCGKASRACPTAAALHYALGLTLVRQKKTPRRCANSREAAQAGARQRALRVRLRRRPQRCRPPQGRAARRSTPRASAIPTIATC